MDPEKEFRETAKKLVHEEGSIEIDDDAIVSVSDDGAYVQAWIWISSADVARAKEVS